jgi:SHS family lactate transporter-like MFS transporter
VTPAPPPWWREPTAQQWSCFLAAWAGWVVDAFDFTVYLLVAAHIADEFGATLTAVNGVVAATLLCRLLGGLLAGSVADRWSRRPVLTASILMMALCDGAIALAPSLFWVLVLRVLFGFAMGAEWTAGATMAMENWPERSRGLASGVGGGPSVSLAALASRWVVLPGVARHPLAATPALLVVPLRSVRDAAAAPGAPEAASGVCSRPARPRGLGHGAAAGFACTTGLAASYPAMLVALR